MAPSIFEYLPKHASALFKLATGEKKEVENPVRHGLGTVGLGLLGLAGGTAAGYGAAALTNKLYEKVNKQPIPVGYLLPAGAVLGAGLGLAYSKYKGLEQEELRRAVESHRNRSSRDVPGE